MTDGEVVYSQSRSVSQSHTHSSSVSDGVHLIITSLLNQFVEIRRQQVIKDETKLHANITQLHTVTDTGTLRQTDTHSPRRNRRMYTHRQTERQTDRQTDRERGVPVCSSK